MDRMQQEGKYMAAKINRTVTLHRGRVFELLRENITLENGVSVDLDIIRHPGASAIVPVSNQDSLLLVRQYRHAVGDFIWEIPAGTLNPNETPLECAKRELIEETGFSANKWEKLGEITPVPGYSDERIHIFLCGELTPARQDLDKDEVLGVHEIRLDEAVKMIGEGLIQDGKTICGLFLLTRWRKDRGGFRG
jgi:ADP-ribose pyrophosphatase